MFAGACSVAAPVSAHKVRDARHETASEEIQRPAKNRADAVAEHASVVGIEETRRSPSRHHEAPEGVPPLLAWIGRFHPPLVHFPIALLSAAALAELLFAATRRTFFDAAVRFCVWGGALGALSAALLGWLFGGFRIVDEDWVMTSHRWLGTATATWAALMLAMCERVYRRAVPRRGFRLALFTGSALVGVEGFLGGSLVYGIDHYAW
jgi:uncharacterized membrane protein